MIITKNSDPGCKISQLLSKIIGLKLLWLTLLLLLAGCSSVRSPVGTGPIDAQNTVVNSQIHLAMSLIAEHRFALAKRQLLLAQQQFPQSALTKSALGYYYWRINNTVEARHFYQQALNLAPNNPTALNQYAVFLCRTGKVPAAEDYFAQALRSPEVVSVADINYNAGQCALRAGHSSSAISHFKRAISIDQSQARLYLQLARAYYQHKQYSSSLNELKHFWQLQPKDKPSLELAAKASAANGQGDLAASYRLQQASLSG